MKLGGLLPTVVVIGVASLGAASALGQSQNDTLGFGFSCEVTSGQIELTITLRNLGAVDKSAYFGVIVGNGKKYLTNELALDVKDAHGTTRYRYFDPSVPAIAGRLDPWVITLPANSSFSIVRPANHFWVDGAPLSEERDPFEVRLLLVARKVPREFLIPNFRAFVGELRSDWLRIPSGCRTAA